MRVSARACVMPVFVCVGVRARVCMGVLVNVGEYASARECVCMDVGTSVVYMILCVFLSVLSVCGLLSASASASASVSVSENAHVFVNARIHATSEFRANRLGQIELFTME
jgi:hypothetical protein